MVGVPINTLSQERAAFHFPSLLARGGMLYALPLLIAQIQTGPVRAVAVLLSSGDTHPVSYSLSIVSSM